PDNSIFASGKNPSPESYTISTSTKLTGITALRLEVLSDRRLPAGGPGRAPNGDFVLSRLRGTAAPQNEPTKARPVALGKATADFSQDGFPVQNAVAGTPDSGWAVAPAFGTTHRAVFEVKEPVGFPAGTVLTFTLDQKYAGKDHNIGKLRLSASTAKGSLPLEGLPDSIGKILNIDPAKRTPEQKTTLTNYYTSTDAELARLRSELAANPAPADPRLLGAQDLSWALINSPAFLFNH